MGHVLLCNTCSIPRIKYFYNLGILISRHKASSPPPPQTVLLEKCLEEPVIFVPDKNKIDMIGPPDPVSNLRPIFRQRLIEETPIQKQLRELQDITQAWNKKFWTDHNLKFISEKNNYVKKRLEANSERKTLTADEMSEFYKTFLNENWKKHVDYNITWYKKNFTLLGLSLRVSIENFFRGL